MPRSRPGTTSWGRRPSPSPTRSVRAGWPTRRPLGSRRSCERSMSARVVYDLSRLRDASDDEARAYLTSLPGVGPEDRGGRAVIRARPRGDPGGHARASGREASRPGAAERRPNAPTGCSRARARRAANAVARRADPAGSRDLQGADPRCRECPLKDLLSDCPAVPVAGLRIAMRRMALCMGRMRRLISRGH